ncbi:MAG: type II toxin-antitoxin system RelB/DinJ family antitoxin, partial [Spirochaetaceae bacterium]|nr:type II toxin-antitoxin system RelB/DinJ family antitoxin [Spirochaetaceae bacterium]
MLHFALRCIIFNDIWRCLMSMTTINIRTSLETKREAERLFEDFGLSMTSAINVFLKQVIR